MSYSGDTNFTDSTSPTLTQAVKQADSTTTVSSSGNPTVYGQSVTFTATVAATLPATGTPTGQVTFYDGTTAIDTATLVDGTASYTTSALAVGGHSITVQYAGDTNFVGSTSTAIAQTVDQDASTATVASSVNPSVYGQSVTFTATIAAAAPGSGTPTGTVTFYDGTTAIGTGTLSDGSASYTTSALAVAGHSITIQYGGDTNFIGSASTAITQTVNQDGSTATVASSLNPSVYGQTVTFTAIVAAAAPGSGTPTGTVQFMDGSTVLDTAALSGGTATFQTSALLPGTHSITVIYEGDGNFATGTSQALSQNVLPPINVTNDLSVKVGGFIYNRASRQFTQTLTITNISSSPIVGPIELMLTNLKNATLVNQSGTYQGNPYITVMSSGSLGVGQSLTFTLVFNDPTLASISYIPEFLAGPIPPDSN